MSIEMGNDEFILHIRKTVKNSTISNDKLGKAIWLWLRENDNSAEILIRDKPCEWGNSHEITSELTLPKTATQFKFSIETLPRLFRQLPIIAMGQN